MGNNHGDTMFAPYIHVVRPDATYLHIVRPDVPVHEWRLNSDAIILGFLAE